METTIYLITMCSGCQRCSFICCLQLAILIISVMKRKIVASGSYTLMIVSYIPRQPLREYKTNNGQKKNVFISGYDSSVHNDILILCLSGISGIGLCIFRIWYRMKSPLCTCAAVQRASPSFVWICVQLWLYRYVYMESQYISSIFMIFVTKNFTKKLVH